METIGMGSVGAHARRQGGEGNVQRRGDLIGRLRVYDEDIF
jgi:hypothetical protein